MFNRENKKDIENATNIFRTIAAEMGFRKEPINTVILGWEEWDENVVYPQGFVIIDLILCSSRFCRGTPLHESNQRGPLPKHLQC